MVKESAKYSLLISSCDKFSDLWEWHIKLLKRNWNDPPCKIYLVTDKPTTRAFDGVTIISAGEELDFPMRIKYALQRIETEYVLLTLDDYFLIHKVDNRRIQYLVDRAATDHIDYLKLYDRRKTKKKDFEPIKQLRDIDLHQKYAVTLYPAIWSKRFLNQTVADNISPWLYEVSLTQKAIDNTANCKYSQSGAFLILDVVRKGKVLHRADRYFKKNNINIGDRPLISIWTELKLAIMDVISWYAPKNILKGIKKVARKFGMKFYSE